MAADLIGSFAPRWCLADGAYDAKAPDAKAPDAKALRTLVSDRGGLPVIPNNPTRRTKHPFDPVLDRECNVVERSFRRLKDWPRVATRSDKLARNHLAAVTIAAIVAFWL